MIRLARRRLLLLGVAALGVAGGAFALYGAGGPGNTECRAAKPVAERIAPLARGEVAAVVTVKDPKRLPNLAFLAPDGAPKTLADYQGRTVLLNLWATWCAPCRQEMPALDRLQAELGGASFAVVAINVDTRHLDRPPKWLKDNGIAHLAYFGDPEGAVLPAVRQQTGTVGLPTTLLVDRAGCEVGVMRAPAEWSSEDGKRLIRAAIGAS